MNVGILGINSYIGDSFVRYAIKDNSITTTTIDTRSDVWEKEDLSSYDSLLCVAGIAHVSSNPRMKHLYYSVNRDLPVSIASKAKKSGVKQFIYMSSIIVYGDKSGKDDEMCITKNTIPDPVDFYGDSKLQAENKLLQLSDDCFKVLIVRSPMVYGPGCKGNFPRLVRLARKIPVFPNINNTRSFIFIYNLCAFFEYAINCQLHGLWFPQDSEYITTTEIVKISAEYYNHRIWFTTMFNPFVLFLSTKLSFIRKVFSSKYYDRTLSPDTSKYNKYSKQEAITLSLKDVL